MGLHWSKIDGSTALLTGLKVPCEKVRQLRVGKVAPQLLHSGRGRRGVAPAAAEGSSPQQRQQEGQQGEGEGSTSGSRTPSRGSSRGSRRGEGRMGGLGRNRADWGECNSCGAIIMQFRAFSHGHHRPSTALRPLSKSINKLKNSNALGPRPPNPPIMRLGFSMSYREYIHVRFCFVHRGTSSKGRLPPTRSHMGP